MKVYPFSWLRFKYSSHFLICVEISKDVIKLLELLLLRVWQQYRGEVQMVSQPYLSSLSSLSRSLQFLIKVSYSRQSGLLPAHQEIPHHPQFDTNILILFYQTETTSQRDYWRHCAYLESRNTVIHTNSTGD